MTFGKDNRGFQHKRIESLLRNLLGSALQKRDGFLSVGENLIVQQRRAGDVITALRVRCNETFTWAPSNAIVRISAVVIDLLFGHVRMSSTRKNDSWLLVEWVGGGRDVIYVRSVLSPISELKIGEVLTANRRGEAQMATLIARARKFNGC